MSWRVVNLLVAFLATCATVIDAFAVPSSMPASFSSSRWIPLRQSNALPTPPRSLPIVEGAKVLPIAYAAISAALLRRAIRVVDTAERVVLATTASLSMFNLALTDSARLESAKRACKVTVPSKDARTWRTAVRVKLVGQMFGLVCMAGVGGVMIGAAAVMLSNMVFFVCGADRAMHDDDGNLHPLPQSIARTVMAIDVILTIVALAAASSAAGSTRRVICGGFYAGGAIIGALEGMAHLLRNSRTSTGKETL